MPPAGFLGSSVLATTGTQQAGVAWLPNYVHHAGIWSGTPGSWTDLHPPGAWWSIAYSTTGAHQVGAFYPGDGTIRAAFWSGTPESYVDLQQFLPAGYSESLANQVFGSAGVIYIAGLGYNQALGRNEAFLWVKCESTCGNGLLEPPCEECDDGNTVPGDGCNEFCEIEPFFCCNAGNPCNRDSACPEPGDACCLRHCDTGTTPPVCDGLGDPCATDPDCGPGGICCGVCGNERLDEGEECDLGAGNGASDCLCSPTCTIPGRCTDTGACCEDDAACLPGGTCCGNGVTTPPEECDDGNLNNGDCCSDQCLTEATCVPACPGFRGPNILAATVKKRAQFWDKDEDPQDLIERYKTKGDFNFFAGQVRRFDPERQPVRIRYAQNDGSGGRVLLFDPDAILPGDCSVLPLGAPCFPRLGRIGRYRWNMFDKEELVELGVRKLQFKQRDNKIQYRAEGRKAEMLAPVVEVGPNQSLIRQDITVGPFCATVLLGCEEFQNKKGTKTKWKCVPQ